MHIEFYTPIRTPGRPTIVGNAVVIRDIAAAFRTHTDAHTPTHTHTHTQIAPTSFVSSITQSLTSSLMRKRVNNNNNNTINNNNINNNINNNNNKDMKNRKRNTIIIRDLFTLLNAFRGYTPSLSHSLSHSLSLSLSLSPSLSLSSQDVNISSARDFTVLSCFKMNNNNTHTHTHTDYAKKYFLSCSHIRTHTYESDAALTVFRDWMLRNCAFLATYYRRCARERERDVETAMFTYVD